jgi:hypothetical protein
VVVISCLDLHFETVGGNFCATPFDLAPFGRVLEQDRVGVVDVDVDLAVDRQPGQLFEAAPGPADTQVPHGAGRLLGQPEANQLVVVPARPVDEQAGAVLELGEHSRGELLHAWQVHHSAPVALVGEPVSHDPTGADTGSPGGSLGVGSGAEAVVLGRGDVEGPVGDAAQRHVLPRDDAGPFERAVALQRGQQPGP